MSQEKTQKNKDNTTDSTPEGKQQREIGGPKGPDPTRYGDWERRGRCVDF